ncbi:MAG: 7-carboxy-7-deazaguanine synthase QueE [Candidatus Margulisbacteria bacterium]|nr:7-carboxy-7-deazaguanine synthase QueE [Candidatus Margulisiibacteriota bacterium]
MQIADIFSSIQGEGLYIGYRQIFLRLAGCNIDCDYCDENISEGKYYDKSEVLKEIEELNTCYHHSLSITGGEPLLQINDLLLLLPEIKLAKYLETNATLPAYLAEVKKYIDIYSLDYKPGYDKEFQESLEMVQDEDTFIKFVLLPKFNVNDLRKAIEITAFVKKDIPFIIQPVTPHKKVKAIPTHEEIISAYSVAKKKLNDVRVIPQAHKIMHIK